MSYIQLPNQKFCTRNGGLVGVRTAEVVRDGLIAWWRFEEGGGTTVIDSSNNDKRGILTGGPLWVASNGAWGALEFDGIDDKMSFSVDTQTDNFSISFWMYPIPSSDSYGSIFTLSNTYGLYYMGGTRKINFYVGADDISTNPITENAWHHIVVSTHSSQSNPDKSIYYVDGVVDTPASLAGPTRQTFDGMGSDLTFNSFKGRISNFRVYNRRLTTEDVYLLYNNP